jgi:hypothetical protein
MTGGGGPDISGTMYAVALGWPRRARGDGIAALAVGSARTPSILAGDGLEGGFSGVRFRNVGPPEAKDRGCNEQTRRVSTPAALNNAQNN